MIPKVKVCCISSPEEARMAVDAGASALGLVGRMPSGPGVIDDDRIRLITRTVPPGVSTFLLTSETLAEDVIAHVGRTHTDTVQLVDAVPQEAYPLIRAHCPHVRLVQVIHVRDEDSVEEAAAIAEWVDAILLDSGNPCLGIKQLGGTGRTHDWTLSARIVAQSPKPVFLAGGLHAGNVREAIEKVSPYGLDLCSGVRTDGRLDPWKLEAFFRAVQG
ncbi:MAG: phosphoribosylanthranilate isomerase [Chitinophagia bacterium]|nr:phosphoribosylanthranilate isomerase [Chitinophagia bacterium]